jgi:DNA repair protein RecN (Recombination protein N)
MLLTLSARQFAIVAQAELKLGPGMTALTGETGAGKSLMVDALMLVCGARADASVVPKGAERAEVAAEFELTALPDVRQALVELELDEGNALSLRRVIRADGSSRALINDRPVTLATLRAIASRLVEIHGQHEHQALLERSRQRQILDAYGGHEGELAAVAANAARWLAFEREAAALEQRAGSGGSQLEFLRFQLEELAKHVLAPPALEALEHEHKLLSSHGERMQGAERALSALDGDDDGAVRPALARVAADLQRLAGEDAALAPIAGLIGDAAVAVDEAIDALERYRAREDADPERLGEIDRQLARLHDLARKHRVSASALAAREAELRAEYESLAGADARLATLRREQDAALGAWREAAVVLASARAKAARRLTSAVTGLLNELGMGGGRFEVQLEALAGGSPSPGGTEEVEFLVSANPGQSPRALRKVASGGELSRISLAIEVAALGRGDVPTMVFDEVDSGIGGAVAEVVGRKLRELGRERQVLCVTHLAQVAAQADRQFAVAKQVEGGRTHTRIVALEGSARSDEIARMIGGVKISRETLAHARDMLERAREA